MKTLARRKTDLSVIGLLAVALSLGVATLAMALPHLVFDPNSSSWIDLPVLYLCVAYFAGPGAVAGVIPLVGLLAALERRGASAGRIYALGFLLGSILGSLNACLGTFLLWGGSFQAEWRLVAIGTVSGVTAGVSVSLGVLRRRRSA